MVWCGSCEALFGNKRFMLNEIVVILVIRNSFSLNMVSLTVDVCQVYVNIDLSNDNSLIHAARNPKLLKMNSEKKIFFPSFLIPKTWQISLDNFIKKKPHISEDLQHKNPKRNSSRTLNYNNVRGADFNNH